MLTGLLMELDDRNCWTIAEAIGHRGPYRLQHLLSRAVWDDQQILDIAAAWAARHLDDGNTVLIDEPLMRSPPPTVPAQPAGRLLRRDPAARSGHRRGLDPEPSSAGVRLIRHLPVSSGTGATANDGRPPLARGGLEAKAINIDILLTCR
jgi:hypothetical protein